MPRVLLPALGMCVAGLVACAFVDEETWSCTSDVDCAFPGRACSARTGTCYALHACNAASCTEGQVCTESGCQVDRDWPAFPHAESPSLLMRGDGTLEDLATGLVWRAEAQLTLPDGASCGAAHGFNDWRVASLAEIMSVVVMVPGQPPQLHGGLQLPAVQADGGTRLPDRVITSTRRCLPRATTGTAVACLGDQHWVVWPGDATRLTTAEPDAEADPGVHLCVRGGAP